MRSSFKYSFYGDTLGARRRRRKSLDQLNNALVDSDARAYADHMQSIEFQQSIQQFLSRLSTSSPTTLVLMCSESNPEQCHRSFLADYLTLVHQIPILHILFTGETCNHQLHPRAKLDDRNRTCVVYPKDWQDSETEVNGRN